MLASRGHTPGWNGMSPFDAPLNNFPQSPAANWRPELMGGQSAGHAWGPIGGFGGQTPQWQDTSNSQLPDWPSSPPPQNNRPQNNRWPSDGFNSTAWHAPGTPSASSQPVGDGWFGARPQHSPSESSQANDDGWFGGADRHLHSPTNPYSPTSAYTSTPYSPSTPLQLDGQFGGIASGPASAPLPSPPLRDRPKRAFSLKPSKRHRDDDWFPRPEKGYGEFNISRRPRDWPQDFELHPSIVKKVVAPKNRSDVKGHLLISLPQECLYSDLPTESPDPMKRSVHALLLYSSNRPPLNMDIRYPPFSGTENTLFNFLGRSFNQIDLLQLATAPAAPFMRLYHPRYPWYIDVRPSNPNGVTVHDILTALHTNFTMPIRDTHYWNEEVTSQDKAGLNMAYRARCRNDQELLRRGILRCDFLGAYHFLRLQGLVRGRMGMWEMKIAVVD